MLRAFLLSGAVCGLLAASLRGGEAPEPPTGEVRLESGRVAHYSIHFDRNALADSLRIADGLIALTSSGALLQFELPALRLVRERIDTAEVTCLGRGEGDTVVAGLADGRVCRIDPATLDLVEIARLPSPLQWVGWAAAGANRPAGPVVVTKETRAWEQGGKRIDVACSMVHDLAAGKVFSVKDEGPLHFRDDLATRFLLDRAGRIWLGDDNGEWGGWVTYVDLNKGTVADIKPPGTAARDYWDGVYGFVELGDGQVWAFGGTLHMGTSTASIERIDAAKPRRLYQENNWAHLREDPAKLPDPVRPEYPITHVVEENGRLLVLSYSDVFLVDRALRSWRNAGTLQVRYRWGRPDAVGAYPSVRAVHPPVREGEPWVLATAGDGYVVLDGLARAGLVAPSKVLPVPGSTRSASPTSRLTTTARSLPGQLSAEGVYRVENTAEGTLCFEDGTMLPAWRPSAKGWELAALQPPFEPDPAAEAARVKDGEETEKASDEGWASTQVLVGPGGTIATVSGTSWDEGTRTTARWSGGQCRTIARETSSLNPATTFLTGDGTLWSCDSGVLKRLQKGRWETVDQRTWGEPPFSLRALATSGPPWILLDGRYFNLWRLDPGRQAEQLQLSPIEITEGGQPLRIDDAIAWSNDALLLATDAGLREYAPGTGKLSRIDLPEPPCPPTTLVRDGLGRLWLGCGSIWTARRSARGLWLVEPGAKKPEAFDRVPWVAGSEVYCLATDPDHPDGVIAALGPRGVAYVRAGPGP
jgi:hypothetical protein